MKKYLNLFCILLLSIFVTNCAHKASLSEPEGPLKHNLIGKTYILSEARKEEYFQEKRKRGSDQLISKTKTGESRTYNFGTGEVVKKNGSLHFVTVGAYRIWNANSSDWEFAGIATYKILKTSPNEFLATIVEMENKKREYFGSRDIPAQWEDENFGKWQPGIPSQANDGQIYRFIVKNDGKVIESEFGQRFIESKDSREKSRKQNRRVGKN